MNTYHTKGTCSRQILYDITPEGTVSNVKFIGGCLGNLQAVSRLVEGKTIDEVIFLLKGIQCRAGTSCADQLAKALEQYQENHPELEG